MTMTFTTATTADIILLSACAFAGNVGKAVTGFGMAIIFLFVWQIVELAGYEGEFKYAVFVQSLALFAVQPLAMYNAQVIKHSYRYILLLFVPVTLISTPLGQLVSDKVPTKTVQAVAGVLVTLVACWEIYSKRNWFMTPCKKKKEDEASEENQVDEMEKKTEDEASRRQRLAAAWREENPVDETKATTNHSNTMSMQHICTEAAVQEDTEAAAQEGTQSQSQNMDGDDEFEDNEAVSTEQDQAEGDNSEPEVPEGRTTIIAGVRFEPETPSNRGRVTILGGRVTLLQRVMTATEFLSASSRRLLSTDDEFKIGPNKATFWTLLSGGASGFLGGMVAIRGPPLIFYFLHPPYPIEFNKNTQRATATVITFFNVTMRQFFYLANTFSSSGTGYIYQKEDWILYLSVIICSIAGAMVGNKMFEYLKDSKDTIRGILSVFLFLCGVSLLFSAFRVR